MYFNDKGTISINIIINYSDSNKQLWKSSVSGAIMLYNFWDFSICEFILPRKATWN